MNDSTVKLSLGYIFNDSLALAHPFVNLLPYLFIVELMQLEYFYPTGFLVQKYLFASLLYFSMKSHSFLILTGSFFIVLFTQFLLDTRFTNANVQILVTLVMIVEMRYFMKVVRSLKTLINFSGLLEDVRACVSFSKDRAFQ